MNPSHTLSLVAHHRARSGEWLIKKLMEDFQVIIGFIQETEATSHGNVTADRRINLLRSSKRVFRNIDKFKGNMTDLDFIMNDMQVQLQVHVCEAVKTGPIFPQTIAAPGPLSFANNPLPSKFRDYQMPDKFSNADVSVDNFTLQKVSSCSLFTLVRRLVSLFFRTIFLRNFDLLKFSQATSIHCICTRGQLVSPVSPASNCLAMALSANQSRGAPVWLPRPWSVRPNPHRRSSVSLWKSPRYLLGTNALMRSHTAVP